MLYYVIQLTKVGHIATINSMQTLCSNADLYEISHQLHCRNCCNLYPLFVIPYLMHIVIGGLMLQQLLEYDSVTYTNDTFICPFFLFIVLLYGQNVSVHVLVNVLQMMVKFDTLVF